MGMWPQILLILAGLFLLQRGASWFVEGSSGLARRLKVSELAIGLTIVAFGTSAPELIVNTLAAWNYRYDIVLGNIIGSNSFNLFIILSVAGLIIPLNVQSPTAWKEIPFSFLAIVVLFLVANDNLLVGKEVSVISRLDGLLLLGCFLLFIFYVWKQLRKDRDVVAGKKVEWRNGKIVLFMLLGLAGLVIGGKLVLDHAVKLATQLGMSERLIGLTIVAAGTSLPELATSVVAALKRSSDIAVGNIIGSNIFNIFFILGVSAVVRPLPYTEGFNVDLMVLAAGTLLLFLSMYTGQKLRIDRWEAFVLFSAYLLYFFWVVL